ncbi:MAG: enoyl-CoA hydratase/isomerase family protein [Rhodothermia bacterium]
MPDLIEKTSKRVRELTLNRPEARNALSGSLVHDLRAALAAAASDDRIRSVVITGSGKAFSAGADLAELKTLRSASLTENRRSSEALAGLFREIRIHPKPVVAKVNGHAIAGGCGLAVACDFAIVSSKAKLGFSEVKIGFVPAMVSHLLRRRVHDAALRDLLLTGRLVDASEAAEMGLVTGTADPAELDDAVLEITNAVETNTSPTAVALTKRMLATTEGMSFDAALTFLASYNALARQTGDVGRGVTAFLDKKDLEW